MPVQFTCEHCGRPIRIREGLAGRRVNCPGCSATVSVPAGPPQEAARGGPAPPGAGKQPAGSWLPLLVGLAALLVAVGGGAYFYWRSRPAVSDAGQLARWVPGDAQAFLSIRVADVWNSAPAGRVRTELQKVPGLHDPAGYLFRVVGLRPDEVERATVVVKDARAESAWVVIETAGPYDEAPIRERLHGAQEVAHAGASYLKGSFGPGPVVCVHFHSARLILFGPEPGVRDALSGPGAPATGALADALKLLTSERQVVGCLVPSAEESERMKRAVRRRPWGEDVLALYEARSATLTGRLSGDDLHIEAAWLFPDDGGAQAAGSVIEKRLDQARLVVSWGLAQDEEAKRAFDLADKTLDSVQINQDGARLVVQARLELGAEAVALIPPVIERFRGAAMPGPGMRFLPGRRRPE